MHLGVQLSTGEFGIGTSLNQEALQASYALKNGLEFFTDAETENVRGLDATVDTLINSQSNPARDKDNWKKNIFGGGLNYSHKKNDASLSYHYSDIKTDIDKGAYQDDDNSTLHFFRNTVSGMFRHLFNAKYDIELNAGYSQFNVDPE